MMTQHVHSTRHVTGLQAGAGGLPRIPPSGEDNEPGTQAQGPMFGGNWKGHGSSELKQSPVNVWSGVNRSQA